MNMPKSPIVQPLSLRAQVQEEILRRLVEGELPAGSRVNETELAAEFGVSQTPIREALFGLEREGLLSSRPGRGFTAAPLQAREVEEVLGLLAALEPMALRSGGLPGAAAVRRLRRLNQRFAGATPPQSLALDRQWHETLLGDCGNSRLDGFLRSLRRALYRYDYAYFSEQGNRDESTRSHDAILDALEAGDVERAATHLSRNWMEGLEPMLAWLEQREVPTSA